MPEPLLDPTGDSDRSTNTTLAPRPQMLKGLVVGVARTQRELIVKAGCYSTYTTELVRARLQ